MVPRRLLLLLFAAVLPACGGGHRHAGPPPAAILFAEDFAGPVLSPDWAVSGTGTTAFDLEGTPGPGLSLAPPPGPPGTFASIRVTTEPPDFGSPPVSISVDLLYLAEGLPSGSGSAGIEIFDPAAPSIGASLFYDAATGDLSFEINGALAPLQVDPGGWHTYTFSVDSGGTAIWTIDGAVHFLVTGFPPANLALSLFNDSNSVFTFDSVLVTSP